MAVLAFLVGIITAGAITLCACVYVLRRTKTKMSQEVVRYTTGESCVELDNDTTAEGGSQAYPSTDHGVSSLLYDINAF